MSWRSDRNDTTTQGAGQMKVVKSLVIATMALCLVGVVAAATAQAEEPVLLCFPEKCLEGLEGHFREAAANALVTLADKEIAGTGVEGKIKECKELGSSKKDTTLCNMSIAFTGMRLGKVACRSETSGGTKSPVEEVAVQLDLHFAAEMTGGGALQTLILLKFLGVAGGEEELIVNCGGVKEKAKGALACLLLPGLTAVAANTEQFEILCKLNATSHDPETGTCELLCEWLKEHPFEANLGAGFEDAWMNIRATGAFNREVFLDD
jgi:hypothetical protein